MDAAAAPGRDQRPRGKWSGGTEVSCRGGPIHDDVADTSCSDEQGDVCWVCLDGASPGKPLIRPCKCPRFTHSNCIARWQLQSAGSRKEMFCEFCSSKLPDWKHALTPPCGSQAPAVMNVNFGGRTYSFEVQPGPEGYRRFTSAIRAAFALPEDSELNITFTCDEPNTEPVPPAGSLLTLQGAGAYDAAVHCASVSAARRISTGSPLAQAPIWGSPSTSSTSAGGAGSSGGAATGGGATGAGGSGAGAGSSKSRVFGGLGRRLRNAMMELFGSGAGGGGAGPAGGSAGGAAAGSGAAGGLRP